MERARKKALSARRHHLKTKHRMSLAQYERLYELQGGVCYGGCGAKGTTKSLAVDHDHSVAKARCSHPHTESCSQCWRGLLCGNCNTTLSRVRDDVDRLLRLVGYLQAPPAQRWILSGQLRLEEDLREVDAASESELRAA